MTYMEDVLRKLGWNSGFHVPVANEENKALEAEVERLMLRKAKAATTFDGAVSRFTALGQHLKFVKQENEENQNLLATYKQQLDSENHKFIVMQSENQCVQQKIRQFQRETEDTNCRNDGQKGDLTKGLTKMEKLKSETSWDVEALKAWEESLKKRDEDNEMLKKFSKEDVQKANELEAKRQNVAMEVTRRKESLAKMIADVTNYEQILERTHRLFKQQKHERDAVVQQWQAAVNNLKKRDEDITRANIEISAMENLILQQQEILDEQNNFYNNEINNNKELQQQIETTSVISSRTRQELNELVQYVLTLNSEAMSLKKNLVSSANFLENERLVGRNLVREINHKHDKITDVNIELVGLKKKLNDVKCSSLSAADRAKHLEGIIQHEERQTRTLTADIERMQGVLFRSQQTVNGLRETAKQQEMSISGSEMTTSLLRKHAKSMYNELQKQKEIIYDLDYRINELERRLAKLEGETTNDEDRQVLDDKIAELEKTLAEHIEAKYLLQGQTDRSEDEMRRLRLALSTDDAQLNAIRSKLNDQVYLFEGGTKQVAAAKLRAQQIQVEENVLRLKVDQFEKTMGKEDHSIYSLQKYKLELETAMRERQIEINTNKEILSVKCRNLNEEKGRLKCDIMKRRAKIETNQKKYHVAMGALGKGDDGEPLSITHFKIKNAQEKYALQEEGDELDAKVKRAEKEIIAMENTLELVNIANTTYKQSLSTIEEDGAEVKEMARLQKVVEENLIALNKIKRSLHAKQLNLQELILSLEDVERLRNAATEDLIQTQGQVEELGAYNDEKQKKIHTANKHLNVLSKALAEVNIDRYHKNLLIRYLQDSNKSALQQLAEMSVRYQEVTPLIGRYVAFHKLKLPGPRLRLTPSTSSETVSSLCSIRSAKSDTASASVAQLVLTFPSEMSADKSSAHKSSTSKNGRRPSKDK